MNENPIRLLIYGAGGQMGRALLSLLPEFPAFQLEAAVSRSDHPLPVGVPAFGTSELAAVPDFDVAIDFSLAPAFDVLLAECVRRGSALVSGTTGLSTGQRLAMDAAAERIALVWARNFSPAMAVLNRLCQLAAGALPDWDCEILEMHHRHKQDAPSGSAIALAEAVRNGRGEPPGWVVRNAVEGARQPGQIGIASQRGGDVVGEHTVGFYGSGERLELVHRAQDRGVFARGALLAAQRLAGRSPGLYGLDEMLLTEI